MTADANTTAWRPHPKQEEMLRWRGIRELLFGGARGGGKTEAGIIWIASPALRQVSRRYRGLVLRENAVDLSDWCDRAIELLGATGARLTGAPKTITWPSGAKILCGHLKDMKSIRKWLGREFQRILIEELTSISSELLYEQLLGSCRSTVPELEARLLATTNPGGPGHAWVKRRFVDFPEGVPFRVKAEDGTMSGWRLFIRSRIEDNPTLMEGDPDYVRYLRSLPPDLRAQWLEGSWDIIAGQYYPEFSRDRHVVRPFEIPPHWRRYRAIDWGYFPDPWFCLWFAVDEHGHEVCYREAYGNRMLPSEVAARIKDLSRSDGGNFGTTVCGVDAWAKDDGPSSAEKMERAGLPLMRANTDRKNGWMRVHEYLAVNPASGLPWVRFFDTCTEIIRCLPALIHDEHDPMDVMENSDIDHGPDALRYHFMRRPARGILAERIPGPRSLKVLRYRKVI